MVANKFSLMPYTSNGIDEKSIRTKISSGIIYKKDNLLEGKFRGFSISEEKIEKILDKILSCHFLSLQ